ncbi:MAG: ACT domain-containing protein, partial [Elusimicrobia bacterium]|nr:ACT domain-containing protein [Elusimicrobiota bacterium]MBD3412020.1 ACT domain-containing protein [Elusimicrobiota bacterium]
LMPITETVTRYYLRFTTIDKPGVLAKISGILGDHHVSIASVYQSEPIRSRRGVPILIVTHHAKEGNLINAIKKIDRLSVIKAKTIMIRIEE